MDTKQKKMNQEHINDIIQKEKKELSDIFEAIKQRETLAENVNDTYDEESNFAQRLADKIADFGWSRNFIIIFLSLLVGWMILNTILWDKAFDTYPFILLNLFLSSIAALQAPVIMMSQKRQEVRDRLRAENDYKVNLKAEVEIRSLHDKIDHLMMNKWDHLIEIQQMQLEMIEDKKVSKKSKTTSNITKEEKVD
jgi:uncharacterized membrane protein